MMQAGNRNTLLLIMLILLSLSNFFTSKNISEKVDEFVEEMKAHALADSEIVLMHGGRISIIEERLREIEEKLNARKN